MRLIDADELRREIDVDKYGHINTTITRLNIALDRCKVDAVPVVRCKDCKWWDKKDGSPYGYCHVCKHGYWSEHWEISIYRTYKGDWYCADGERRTDG